MNVQVAISRMSCGLAKKNRGSTNPVCHLRGCVCKNIKNHAWFCFVGQPFPTTPKNQDLQATVVPKRPKDHRRPEVYVNSEMPPWSSCKTLERSIPVQPTSFRLECRQGGRICWSIRRIVSPRLNRWPRDLQSMLCHWDKHQHVLQIKAANPPIRQPPIVFTFG